MNLVDAVVLAALVVFAWSGWRQGFVAGLLSFVGFLAGGLAAALLLPQLVERANLPYLTGAILLAGAVLVCAVLGQALASMLGRRLRSGISWQSARFADSAAGAALNVIALAAVLWIIASAVSLLPEAPVSRQIRSSALLTGIDRLVPDQARDLFADLRGAVDASGLPRVFAGLAEYAGPEVPAPDRELLRDPAVRAAWPSLVKVSGSACASGIVGSGFVYAPDLVMTNAHVVAGMDSPRLRVPGDAALYAGEVVAIDPRIDLAVIRVADLPAPPIRFAERIAETGDSAVVAGFPGGGDLVAEPARIRDRVAARGEDVYGRSGVVREVYAFRGIVVPGNSGGPLLAPNGRVLGVVFAAGLGAPDTGYAITAQQAESIAEAGLSSTAPVDTGACRS